MSWVRSDDNEPNHPKIFRAGAAAYGFFQAAKCYCSRNLTDGFVPVGDLSLVLPGLTFKQAVKLSMRLVECGLFEKEDAGYRVHDYLHYNPSRSEILERRATRAASGRLGGLRSADARRTTEEAIREASASAHPQAVAWTTFEPRPGPARPIPEKKEPRVAENGSSPPPTFQIPGSIEAALSKCPTLGPALHNPRFWQAQVRSKPGVNFAAELLQAESWVVANPQRAPKKSVPAFMNRWFGRAYEGVKA